MASEPHADGLDAFISDARSVLARLCDAAPVPHRRFVFGGAGERFGAGCVWALRALPVEDKMRALADAFAYLTTKGGWQAAALYEQNGAAVLDLESKVQTLARALVDPADPTQPAAKGPDEIRKRFEADEVAALFEQFVDYDEERSPLSKLRTWEDVEPLVVALGKGFAKRTALSSYDTASLRFIITCLASRYVTLTRPDSSDSSSPSATSTT